MMKKSVQKQLLEINRAFYDQFAPSFSTTRNQVQPGVKILIDRIDPEASVVDVGCGNGTFARALAEFGFCGDYLGLDMSAGLISRAEQLLNAPQDGAYIFQLVDLANPDWHKTLPGSTFDWLVSFAVLHHLPGDELRQQTTAAFANLVTPKSRVVVSVWQWHHSRRLRRRVLPWSTVGRKPEELDEGDVLLDWRAGDSPGLRYVHTFSEDSLTGLAQSAGFEVNETFYSDGKTGDLALYQVWQLKENPE